MSTPEAPIRMSTRWPGERSAYGNAEFVTPNNLLGPDAAPYRSPPRQ
jgi:hypothetical protein